MQPAPNNVTMPWDSDSPVCPCMPTALPNPSHPCMPAHIALLYPSLLHVCVSCVPASYPLQALCIESSNRNHACNTRTQKHRAVSSSVQTHASDNTAALNSHSMHQWRERAAGAAGAVWRPCCLHGMLCMLCFMRMLRNCRLSACAHGQQLQLKGTAKL